LEQQFSNQLQGKSARSSQHGADKGTARLVTPGCLPAQLQHLLVPLRNKGDVQSHKPLGNIGSLFSL